ncbi:L,D-transpeptidase family protein [Thalassotalea mangrovi]|uniref:L,D-TPase catalytic domain-containing protein n=1 Tax=Thalassotalea mangrovi TaxID=2572245 RepID=A0A4U1B472_9GAMM|nr:L,D-transpeptidase family protein [Thalassotalea mangrovi]TKB44223.1 hypothetical protein E8M12_12465 [Thalassotalea mangrovi]
MPGNQKNGEFIMKLVCAEKIACFYELTLNFFKKSLFALTLACSFQIYAFEENNQTAGEDQSTLTPPIVGITLTRALEQQTEHKTAGVAKLPLDNGKIELTDRHSESLFSAGIPVEQHLGLLLVQAEQQTQDELLYRYQLLKEHGNIAWIWFEDGELSASGRMMRELSSDLGLLPFNPQGHMLATPQAIDLALTASLMSILTYRSNQGELDIEQLDAIASTLIGLDDRQSLDSLLIPAYRQVSLLRTAINDYQQLSRKPWPNLKLDFEPKLGQQHLEIYKLREILTALGDLPRRYQTQNRQDIFDAVATKAIERFQQRHGLVVDGRVGKKTLAALKITASQRLHMLQANLWRWLKFPTQAPEDYLLVNIPHYRLHLVENSEPKLEMRVIVGDTDNQTPEMISTISGLTLNPTWTPPPKIIKNELLPAYEEDYLYLSRKKFRLVQGYWRYTDVREIDAPQMDIQAWLETHRLVQMPGKTNPLGAFRFNIPNNQAIYLHDTPAKHLFRRNSRALSHGCVRVEQPDLLANYLLPRARNSYKFENELDELISSGETRTINMKQPLPVFIAYHTAWFNESGELHFFDDVYRRDRLPDVRNELAIELLLPENPISVIADISVSP